MLTLLLAIDACAASADVAACLANSADAERLACYDRTLGRGDGSAPRAPVASPAIAITPSPIPLATVPAANTAALEIPPAAPTAAAPAADRFGQSLIPVAVPKSAFAKEPDRIVARVIGRVDGPARGQELRLDNGQRWRNIDDRELDYVGDNPQVTLWRNLIGSYWLRFEPRGPQLRVRRVK